MQQIRLKDTLENDGCARMKRKRYSTEEKLPVLPGNGDSTTVVTPSRAGEQRLNCKAANQRSHVMPVEQASNARTAKRSESRGGYSSAIIIKMPV